jgi:hypothetical protein
MLQKHAIGAVVLAVILLFIIAKVKKEAAFGNTNAKKMNGLKHDNAESNAKISKKRSA